MSLRKSIPFAILTALACGSAQAHADANTPRCALGHYAPTHSQPYLVEYDSDFGDFSVLYGAKLFVPAEPGLTREWLTRDLVQALAKPVTASSTCPLPVQSVQVDVESAGPGFWVLLKGKDEREGAELLRWASKLAAPASTARP